MCDRSMLVGMHASHQARTHTYAHNTHTHTHTHKHTHTHTCSSGDLLNHLDVRSFPTTLNTACPPSTFARPQVCLAVRRAPVMDRRSCPGATLRRGHTSRTFSRAFRPRQMESRAVTGSERRVPGTTSRWCVLRNTDVCMITLSPAMLTLQCCLFG